MFSRKTSAASAFHRTAYVASPSFP